MIASDTTSEMTTTPIVNGSRVTQWLKYARSAVTRQAAAMSSNAGAGQMIGAGRPASRRSSMRTGKSLGRIEG